MPVELEKVGAASARRRSKRYPLTVLSLATGSLLGLSLLSRPPGPATLDESARLTTAQFRGARTSFDLSTTSVPAGEIRSGGVPKDAIPAISEPRIIAANQASFLKGEDRVIGVKLGGVSRAYPLMIMNHHEIVNDILGDRSIAVTYCPLCDSAVVFDRKTESGAREFGVSGLLYNSNILMYDRSESESLWSQMRSQAVSGVAMGEKLSVVPMELVSWRDWQHRHPDTDVLSPETGLLRDYRRNPYKAYFRQPQTMFPVRPINRQLALKDKVLGVWDESSSVAFPVSKFRGKSLEFRYALGEKQMTIAYDGSSKTLRIVRADEGLNWAHSFWFAWYAFHPDTQVFTLDRRQRR